MPFGMISTISNFMPTKVVAGGGGVSISANWVAVGGGSIIAKSSDGNLWSQAGNVGGIATYGRGVAYGKNNLGAGLWVAVGDGTKMIARSTDGNLWSMAGNVSGISTGLGVAYGKDGSGNGLWVAVGGGGLIAKSSDGNVWSAAGDKGGITTYGFGVAYGKDGAGGNLWVAVGGGSFIAKSSDGNLWSKAGNVGGITYGYGVAYGKDGSGNGLWVAVGQDSFIAKSSDGNLWSKAGNVGGIAGSGQGVAYGKDGAGQGLWVAVGGGSIIAKSSDGNLWSPAATVSGVFGKGGITNGRGVAYGKDDAGQGLWVAVGDGGFIAKSSDGNVWSAAGDKGGIATYGFGVAFKDEGVNTNAPNFTQVASTVLSTRYIGVAISDTGKYILSVVALTTGQPTSGVFYLSTNFGSTFNVIPGFTTGQNYYCSMSGTGQYMVMIVNNGYMYRSGDYGSTWQQVTNISETQNWLGVSLSKNGKCCLAYGIDPTNNLYVSSNFDTANPTFTTVSVYEEMWTLPGVNAISYNGQTMIQLNCVVDGIAISSNFGVSFSKLTFANIGVTGFLDPDSIFMTPDTKIVYLTNYADGLYKSTNLFSGSPMFTKITSAIFTEQTWNMVVASSDGTYVVASTDAKTYYSKDSGVTWLLAYTGRIAYIAMSADARYIVGSNPDNSSKLIFSNT